VTGSPVENYRLFLETLTPGTLERLADYVAADVRFADPFNDVRGVGAMTRVFRHMFDNLGAVRFRIRHCVADGRTCLMAWRFEARLRGKPWAFDGMSLVRFDGDGKVVEHVDHWDAGRDFYERLPLIGGILRRLRRRVADG
jgi:steroid Delta-isomerase